MQWNILVAEAPKLQQQYKNSSNSAIGRNDLLWHSVMLLSCVSLQLKLLWWEPRVARRGWEMLSTMLRSFLHQHLQLDSQDTSRRLDDPDSLLLSALLCWRWHETPPSDVICRRLCPFWSMCIESSPVYCQWGPQGTWSHTISSVALMMEMGSGGSSVS